VKVLVTGADGFVGSQLAKSLASKGHDVVGSVRLRAESESERIRRESLGELRTVPIELLNPSSVHRAVTEGWDAVIHLAGVSSGAEALSDPLRAWEVNALGTARLAHELGQSKKRGGDPLLVMVSTAEVYGVGPERPRLETDPPRPVSPYAASKLAAEVACLEVYRRTGLRVIVVRPFPHVGPGQDPRFVVPAFLERIRFAKRINAPVVKVGRIDPVREFTHAADVVEAYALILESGRAGEIYNVACGRPTSVKEVFFMLADAVGHRAIPEMDHELIRPVDVPHLVGDSAKLQAETGWKIRYTLEQTIREMVDAEAD
jgi:GDP-4-dehydro-6-deoxy-D-mannose reductase